MAGQCNVGGCPSNKSNKCQSTLIRSMSCRQRKRAVWMRRECKREELEAGGVV